MNVRHVSVGANPNALRRTEPAGLAQCFIAVDVARFAPAGEHGRSGFERRLLWLAEQMRALPTAPGAPGPVLAPGDKEHAAERRSALEGVALAPSIAAAAVEVGEKFGVPRPPALLAAAAVVPERKPLSRKHQPQVSRVLAIAALAGCAAWCLKKVLSRK